MTFLPEEILYTYAQDKQDTARTTNLHYSLLFFPSSAFVYRAVLSVRSCLATRVPITLSFRMLLIASW